MAEAEVSVNMTTPPPAMQTLTCTAVYDNAGDDTIVIGVRVTNPTAFSCTMDFKAAPATNGDLTRFQIVAAPNSVEYYQPQVPVKIYWTPQAPHEEGAQTVYLADDGLDGNGEPVSELVSVCQESMSQ